MRIEWTTDMIHDTDGSDIDSDDFIEYDESEIPEVKLFHKFCRPLNESPLPAAWEGPHHPRNLLLGVVYTAKSKST
ncbi:hypothetical protein QZH41_003593 [Actinostola sp. cb2023]|nr:hypothetical protein QZH41_003593 [Actinostola sp. cb2023]